MSKEYFSREAGRDAAERRQAPAPPVTTEGREDGLSVANLAQERPSVSASRRRSTGPAEAKHAARGGVSWGVLSFGLLLLTSGAACLERLAWMSGH